MGERRPDDLAFVPYGWTEETPLNRVVRPLPAAELQAFYDLREAGEPTIEQLDAVMQGQGHVRAPVRDFMIDDFVAGGMYGEGYNNFLSYFTATPTSLSAVYILRCVTQRYQAAYGDHYERLREIAAAARREGMRPLTLAERYEVFRAYQRMRHLVALDDPDYAGPDYLTD